MNIDLPLSMGSESEPRDDGHEYDVTRDRAMGDDIRANPEPTLNYAIVAVVGLLAGIIIGSVFSQPRAQRHVHTANYPPVAHPRSLASP